VNADRKADVRSPVDLTHGGTEIPAFGVERQDFDVTKHATADSAPVGSINRARWRAEAASRQVRARTEQRTAATNR
jgi:hypothetical protein